MHLWIEKQRGLKVRGYYDIIINIDEYLSVLLGAKVGDKIFEMELNEILLNCTMLFVRCL